MSGAGDEPVLRCEVRRAGDRTIVSAVGELDLAGAGDFDAAIRTELARGPVLLDLERLTFMDSTGVRILDGILRDAEREDWDIAVRPELHRAVRQLLDLTGMLQILPMAAPSTAGER